MKKNILAFCLMLLTGFVSAQNYYFPPNSGSAWEQTDPKSLGWCTDEIPSLYDYLQSTNTKGIIILKNGKIVVEKYFGTFTKDSLWYWASAGKSMTSALVGIAHAEGKLNLGDVSSKYLGKNWTALPQNKEDLITIRHQLTMTTGLDDSGDKDCTTPTCLKYKADAGTRWAYHNAPYTLLDKVIENATGQTFNQYYSAKVKVKTGMTGIYVKSGYNNVNYSNLRSFARFGLLMLNKGKWMNEQIVPTGYFDEMVSSSQNINPSYGYLWWLNGKSRYMLPSSQFVFSGDLLPEAPANTYSALGKNGQILNVVPELDLVFVRMGNSDGSPVPTTYNNEIWKRLNKVICESTSISDENTEPNEIKIFPNPAADKIYISSDHPVSHIEKQVVDALGNTMQIPSNDSFLDVSSLANGMYFLQCKTENGVRVLRFLVSH